MNEQNLFHWMLQYEASLFGDNAQTLQGQSFLQTELQWLNRYLIESFEHFATSELGCMVEFNHISMKAWSDFPRYFYDQLSESELSKVMKRGLSFLKWLVKQDDPPPAVDYALNSLKTSKKDIERIFKIHKHLSGILGSWLYRPGPTDQLEDIEWHEAMWESQKPKAITTIEDTFSVKAKNKKNMLAYLVGENTHEAIVFKTDPILIKLIEQDDRLPLIVGESEEGSFFLKNYRKPFLPQNVCHE